MEPILIVAPYPARIPNGKKNCKEYPWWNELTSLIKEKTDYVIYQFVSLEEKKLSHIDYYIDTFNKLWEQEKLIKSCTCWISVDNYFHHFMNVIDSGKKGIVLWGKTDPLIYGYPGNVNMLKDRANLRKQKFSVLGIEDFDPKVFYRPTEVLEVLEELINI